jgi:hypothetical protein
MIAVDPLHLAFALLCEDPKAFDNDFYNPEESSVLWSVIERENGDPVRLSIASFGIARITKGILPRQQNAVAKELKKRILGAKRQQPTPAPSLQLKPPSKGKGAKELVKVDSDTVGREISSLLFPGKLLMVKPIKSRRFFINRNRNKNELPATSSNTSLLGDGSAPPTRPTSPVGILIVGPNPVLVKVMEGAQTLKNNMVTC